MKTKTDFETHRKYWFHIDLLSASSHGHLEDVKALIKAGADVNYQVDITCPCHTALMEASNRGHLEIVKALIAAGADSALQNKDNKTALDYANAPEIIKALQSKS